MSVLGSLFSKPKEATYTPPTVVAPTPATTADSSSTASGANIKQAAMAAAGLASTIKTGAQGAASTAVGTKSLLGQ